MQVKNVNHIPWGIVGSITGAGLLYFMLALAMVLMTAPNISCPYPSFFSGLGRVNFITVFDGVGEMRGRAGHNCGAGELAWQVGSAAWPGGAGVVGSPRLQAWLPPA